MISLASIEDKVSKLLELNENSETDYIVTSIEDEKKDLGPLLKSNKK